MELYHRITDPALLTRRICIAACQVVAESGVSEPYCQMNLFADPHQEEQKRQDREKEKRQQKAVIGIKHRYGKNAILKGTNFREGATTRQRNKQVGGHRA